VPHVSDVGGFSYRLTKCLEHDLNTRALEVSGAKLLQGSLRDQPLKAWVTGKDIPGVDATQTLAEVLGVDPAWLAFGKETKAPAPAWWKEGE
jgi:hypothetical protein